MTDRITKALTPQPWQVLEIAALCARAFGQEPTVRILEMYARRITGGHAPRHATTALWLRAHSGNSITAQHAQSGNVAGTPPLTLVPVPGVAEKPQRRDRRLPGVKTRPGPRPEHLILDALQRVIEPVSPKAWRQQNVAPARALAEDGVTPSAAVDAWQRILDERNFRIWSVRQLAKEIVRMSESDREEPEYPIAEDELFDAGGARIEHDAWGESR